MSVLARRVRMGAAQRALTKMVLDQSTGCYASTPDSAALSITGDIDIRVALSMVDWTDATFPFLITKSVGAGNQQSYAMYVDSTGHPTFLWTTAGVSFITKASTAAVGVADGSLLCVRATLDVDNGAAGNTVNFYKKTTTGATAHADALSDSSWSALGSAVVTAGTTSIFDSTAIFVIGATSAGTEGVKGSVYATVVKNGIAGTTAFDADCTIQTPGATSFAESSSNAATVTLHGTAALVAQ